MSLRENQAKFVAAIREDFGNIEVISRQQIVSIEEKHKLDRPHWLLNGHVYRASRGLYYVPKEDGSTVSNLPKHPAPRKPTRVNLNATVPTMKAESIPTMSHIPENMVAMAAPPKVVDEDLSEVQSVSLVPPAADGYVPFGHFQDLETIISAEIFYPVYITGLSGNGKTMMVDQVCAKLKRDMIRVNITAETDEDDLLGGFRLVNGQTVWHNGPVVLAMELGAVLLLDEVDLGSIKLMCLQTVLEGRPIFLKKINRVVTPKKGFTVIATANTKGQGSMDGKFIGTNVMNEAFLERFSITYEQEYPSNSTEERILNNVLRARDIDDKDFVKLLVKWAEVIRRTYEEGGVTDIISTRRLVHICEAFNIFGRNRLKAIELCLNRFNLENKKSFMELYTKLDASAIMNTGGSNPSVVMTPTDPPPF